MVYDQYLLMKLASWFSVSGQFCYEVWTTNSTTNSISKRVDHSSLTIDPPLFLPLLFCRVHHYYAYESIGSGVSFLIFSASGFSSEQLCDSCVHGRFNRFFGSLLDSIDPAVDLTYSVYWKCIFFFPGQYVCVYKYVLLKHQFCDC